MPVDALAQRSYSDALSGAFTGLRFFGGYEESQFTTGYEGNLNHGAYVYDPNKGRLVITPTPGSMVTLALLGSRLVALPAYAMEVDCDVNTPNPFVGSNGTTYTYANPPSGSWGTSARNTTRVQEFYNGVAIYQSLTDYHALAEDNYHIANDYHHHIASGEGTGATSYLAGTPRYYTPGTVETLRIAKAAPPSSLATMYVSGTTASNGTDTQTFQDVAWPSVIVANDSGGYTSGEFDSFYCSGALAVGAPPLVIALTPSTIRDAGAQLVEGYPPGNITALDWSQLRSGFTSGTITYLPLVPPREATAWRNLIVNTSIVTGGQIVCKVCDEDGNPLSDAQVPGNNTGLTLANGQNTISLSGVAIGTRPQLKFTFTGTSGNAKLYGVYATFDSSSATLSYAPIVPRVSNLTGATLTQTGGTIAFNAIDYNAFDATATVRIVNGSGTIVRTITREVYVGFKSGYDRTQSVVWDGKDGAGNATPPGSYSASVSLADPYISMAVGQSLAQPYTIRGIAGASLAQSYAIVLPAVGQSLAQPYRAMAATGRSLGQSATILTITGRSLETSYGTSTASPAIYATARNVSPVQVTYATLRTLMPLQIANQAIDSTSVVTSSISTDSLVTSATSVDTL